MTCGVYSIRNRIDGKQYIGSAKDIGGRLDDHYRDLRRDRHRYPSGDRSLLQEAWNKYGEETFDRYTLDECEPERRIEVEQYYLDVFWPTGYNLNPKAGCGPGRPKGCVGHHGKRRSPSKETRQRQSESKIQAGIRPPSQLGRHLNTTNHLVTVHRCECGREFNPHSLARRRRDGTSCPDCGRSIPEKGAERL